MDVWYKGEEKTSIRCAMCFMKKRKNHLVEKEEDSHEGSHLGRLCEALCVPYRHPSWLL